MVFSIIHVTPPGYFTFTFLGRHYDLPNLWLVPIPVTLLAVLGTFVLLVWVFSFLRAIAGATIIPGYDVHRFQSKKARSWAMVTGATSGIGLEFARQLGQSAFYIILVGRRKDALDEVAKELESRWRIQTRVVVVDLAKPGEERDAAYMECKRLSEELDLAVLINNAGLSHEQPESFVDTDPSRIVDIVQTNVLSTFLLTHAVLPGMIARSSQPKSPKSLVLNIGSLAGRIPAPLLAEYSGTKAALTTWTKALAAEVKSHGVMVQIAQPGLVMSKMSKIRRENWLAPSPEVWVDAAISGIGIKGGAQGRDSEMTPFWSHALGDWFAGAFGGWSEAAAIRQIHKMHLDIRKRALRRTERDAVAKTD